MPAGGCRMRSTSPACASRSDACWSSTRRGREPVLAALGEVDGIGLPDRAAARGDRVGDRVQRGVLPRPVEASEDALRGPAADREVVSDGSHAATFWETENYRSDPVLSKGGVGLVLALPTRERVAAVELRTPTPGFTAGVYTSTDAAPPQTLDAWDAGATPRTITKTRQRIELPKAVRARYILIWITRLAPAEGAGFSAQIAEATPLGS